MRKYRASKPGNTPIEAMADTDDVDDNDDDDHGRHDDLKTNTMAKGPNKCRKEVMEKK
jgi:hypothetical protein